VVSHIKAAGLASASNAHRAVHRGKRLVTSVDTLTYVDQRPDGSGARGASVDDVAEAVMATRQGEGVSGVGAAGRTAAATRRPAGRTHEAPAAPAGRQTARAAGADTPTRSGAVQANAAVGAMADTRVGGGSRQARQVWW